MKPAGLERFVEAQEHHYQHALSEIISGRKQTHWMWFIFPQIAGLGRSSIARFYAIRDVNEAQQYFDHPTLGTRLITISTELLRHKGKSAYSIFGSPDEMKLRSSMTLFAGLERSDPVFKKVLDEFFNGRPDEQTLQLLSAG